MDVPLALQAVCQRLKQAPKVVVGLGLHRRMTPSELSPIQKWNIQHEPDDVRYIGQSEGIRGFVSSVVCGRMHP